MCIGSFGMVWHIRDGMAIFYCCGTWMCNVYRMERLLWNFVNLVGWTDGMHGFKDGVALIGWCGSFRME